MICAKCNADVPEFVDLTFREPKAPKVRTLKLKSVCAECAVVLVKRFRDQCRKTHAK